jgi:carbon-monoxide dehydrogenase large subunit
MAHVAFVRSVHPHARIRHIDTRSAELLDGVFGVFTGEDLQARWPHPITIPEETNFNPLGSKVWRAARSIPTLARTKVLFEGDPVVAVAAKDRYVAEDAVDLICIDYEPLEAIAEKERATSPGTPRIHDNIRNNVAARFLPRDDRLPTSHELDEWETERLLKLALEQLGTTERDARRAARLSFPARQWLLKRLEVTFRQQRQNHSPLETRGCVADWDSKEQTLVLYTSTQSPHITRDSFARLLDLPAESIRVIAPDVGGAFGQKAFLQREEVVVSILARTLGRPVKWIEDRRENLMAACHAREEAFQITADVCREHGTILWMRGNYMIDMGAYGVFSGADFAFATQTIHAIPGPWHLPGIRCFGFGIGVHTNKSSVNNYRAPSNIAHFAHESLLEIIAQELQLDPLAVRSENIIRASDQPLLTWGGLVDHVTVDKTLEEAAKRIDYQRFRQEQQEARRNGRYLGLGLSTFLEIGALSTSLYRALNYPCTGREQTTLRLETTGRITANIGVSPHGQGLETTVAQIVADALGIRIEDISVFHGDTAREKSGGGTFASRSLIGAAGATRDAAAGLREKILRVAAQSLHAAVNDLELRGNGRIGVQGDPDREMALASVAASDPGLEATGTFESPEGSGIGLGVHYNGTHACVAEVDTETGEIEILRYLVVFDSGKLVNPKIVEGQILGSVAQGLGGALYEHAAYGTNGQFLAKDFFHYLLPTAAAMPHVEIVSIPGKSPQTPYEAKPVGEGHVMGATAAITNAVSDALSPFGVRISELPLNPPRILDLLRSQSELQASTVQIEPWAIVKKKKTIGSLATAMKLSIKAKLALLTWLAK